MKAKIWLTLLVFSAAVLVAPQVLAQTANWNLEQDSTQSEDGVGFGSRFAGAWFGVGSFAVDVGCDGTFEVPPPGIPFTDVHSFGVDGHHAATNPANPNSGRGTWEKTGRRQITVTDIVFGVDAAGHKLISVIPMVVDFDRAYETALSTFGARVYDITLGQDPFDPSEVPAACTSGEHSFTKVSATE